MLNLARSRWMGIDSWAGDPLYSLAPKIEEGMALCLINEGGIGKSTIIASPSGNIFKGFAYNYFTAPATLIAVETYTVPAVTPFTVTLANTPLTPTTGMLVKDAANAAYAYNAAPAGAQFNVSGSLLTFNATQAGSVITVTYSYNPTVQQIQFLYGDGVAGQTTASAVTGTIGLIRRGIVYTTNFDPTVDWAAITSPTAITVGPNGTIGTSATTTVVPGYVVEAPSVDSPFVGINFSAV